MTAGIGGLGQVWTRARSYLDLALLGAICLGLVFLAPHHLPVGIAGQGVVTGSLVAVQAIGLILVLRSNRIINFAQVQLGTLSATVFYESVRHSQLVLVAHTVCPSCFPGINPDTTYLQSHPNVFTASLLAHHYEGLVAANFWISLVLALAVAPLASYAIYFLVIQRFSRAPRLILTVATLAIAQVVAALGGSIGDLFGNKLGVDPGGQIYRPLHDFTFMLPFDNMPSPIGAGALLHSWDLIQVIVTVLLTAAVLAFFRFSRTGVVIRGAADDSARAQTLGINVGSVTGLIWVFAGVLSAAAAILDVYHEGSPRSGAGAATVDVAVLVPILAAAVFARLRNVQLALGASLVLGIIAAGMSWNLGNPVGFEVLLFVVIAVGLALQRYQPSRGEQEAAAGYLSAKESRPIPQEIRHHHVVVTYGRWAGGALALVLLASPFLLTPSQVSQESAVVIYAIVGLSLLILTGWAGQVSLGQFAFAAAGAYVTAMLRSRAGLDVTLAVLLGGLTGSMVAALVGVGALRLRGLYLAVSTLAFSLAVADFGLDPQFLGRYLPSNLDRPLYLGVDLNDEKWFYYFCLFFLLLTVFVVLGLRRSRTGRTLIAVRDNEDAGQSFGVNLFRLRLGAFVVSGFIAAVAGGLFALHQHSISPRDFSAAQSVNVFLMVIIGGLGSIAGPILGAVYQAAFLLFAAPIFALLGTGFGVLLVLLLFPGGLGAVVYGARDALVRRVAIRYRVEVPGLLADSRMLGQLRRGRVTPRTRPGGGTILVPSRYRLSGQWQEFLDDPDA